MPQGRRAEMSAPVKEPWRIGMPPMKSSQVAVPQKPGLGIEIDERAWQGSGPGSTQTHPHPSPPPFQGEGKKEVAACAESPPAARWPSP